MQHIWLCLIDGVLIRSGPVMPGETIHTLQDRLQRTYPHMGPESLKVVREDGRVFDPELGYTNATYDEQVAKTIIAAVGVVDGHIGVKIHRGLPAEEVLELEAGTFTGKVADNMDFGVFDFTGDQLGAIEDMIGHLEPEHAPDPLYQPPQEDDRDRRQPRGRRSRFRRMRGRPRGGPRNGPSEATPGAPAGDTAATAGDAPQNDEGDDFSEEDSQDDFQDVPEENRSSENNDRSGSDAPAGENQNGGH